MIEFLGWMHCRKAGAAHLDLDGLLSSQDPLSAEHDGDHVGVPLLPVQVTGYSIIIPDIVSHLSRAFAVIRSPASLSTNFSLACKQQLDDSLYDSCDSLPRCWR